MERSDNEEKRSSRPGWAVAALVVLAVIAVVAIAFRPTEHPVEVSAAGNPTESVLGGATAAPDVGHLGSSPTTLTTSAESSTTSATAASSTTSTTKVKSTTTSSTPASSSTTTTATRPLPPSLLGSIVFAGNRGGVGGIWVMEADGANPRNITPTPGHAPDLSPDGRHIVFNSGPGTGGLVIVDSDGRNERTLVQVISVYTPPSWAPDGRRILYADASGLRTVNPDGTGDRLILSHSKYQNDPTMNLSFFCASWAPDSRRLVVTSLGASSADGLWIVDLDTGSATHVFTGSAHEVAWSPLGDRIAFSGGPNPAIFTVRPDGTDLKQLTGLPGQFDGAGSATDPAWSPDGSRIAFTLIQSDSDEIWDVGSEGSSLRNLTNAAGHDRQPTF